MINAEAQSRGDAENERRTPNIEHRTPKSFPFSVLRSAFGVLHIPHPFSFLLSPFSFLLSPPSFSPASPRLCVSALKNPRRGATLLVTLGILTVLSVMAVTFLVATRLQQQTAAAKTHRLATRDQLHEALHLAMQTVESAYCYTNFTEVPLSAEETVENIPPQRLAPVGAWFSKKWTDDTLTAPDDIQFQAPGVLASPPLQKVDEPRTPRFTTPEIRDRWTVNLLTPEVLAMIPSTLTNGIDLTSSTSPFRSSWQTLAFPSTGEPWRDTASRVAFAVFDVSGFLDANYFITGPTTQKLPRVCFSQADVTNWFAHVDHEKIEDLKSQISDLASDPDRAPFSSLSYDPNPDADPFMPGSTVPHPYLGYDSFSRLHTNKVALGTLTNFLSGASERDTRDRIFPVNFWLDWFFPVLRAVKRTAVDEPIEHPDTPDALQIMSLPWNIINAVDKDRLPQISAAAEAFLPDLATRHNYAIEDVPLINKVTIFNIFPDRSDPKDPSVPNLPEEQTVESYYADVLENSGNLTLSNHYAVAIELWYPFATNFPPANAALYAHLWTNASDVVTTSNAPLSQAELTDWFLFNEAATSNTVMQTLFYAWANAYTHAVGPAVWQHPLWQVVTTNADLWFTTNMVSHPSWPVPDDTGHITITNTPVWHAFHPETYEVVTTNQVEFTDTNNVPYLVEIVTTNVYTYSNMTNDYVQWVSEPEMTTNRLAGQIGVTDPDPYPVLLWSDPETSQPATNVFLGFIDSAGTTNLFFTGDQTNHLHKIDATPPNGIYVVSSNGLSGAVATNAVTALIVAPPWAPDDPIAYTIQTNLAAVTVVEPVVPLLLLADPALGDTLEALFGILLAPELNLDTSEELYRFLMLLPSAFDQWDFLNAYLTQFPFIQQTIIPNRRMESLGNMTLEDRIALCDGEASSGNPWDGTEQVPTDHNNDTVGQLFRDGTSKDYGIWWTVFPKQVVCFPKITETEIPGQNGGDGRIEATTNFCAIGSEENFRIWLQANVTVNRDSANNREGDERGIADVAFLTENGNSVQGWWSVTNACIADPRHNAYAAYWRGFSTTWDEEIGRRNLSTEVTEYPFIQPNAMFAGIGELGHVYASPDRWQLTWNNLSPKAQDAVKASLEGLLQMEVKLQTKDDKDSELLKSHQHDTIAFDSRPGAALLDTFTLYPHSAQTRGLVQANTYHPSVVETLFADAEIGWKNLTDNAGTETWRTLDPNDIYTLTNRYINSLSVDNPEVYGKSDPPDPLENGSMGWKSFADMLPAIMTNPVKNVTFTLPKDVPDNFAHDWIEDAVRHLPDRVSFRQNIFVIVIAAQTLSPVSTPSRPVVLADQRAAVTVIRDAFTGRWTIHDWRWLTE